MLNLVLVNGGSGRLLLTSYGQVPSFFVDALVRIPHTFIGSGDCETKIV